MNHINITLVLKEQRVDIRIPNKLEVSHLLRELDHIFGYRGCREKYQLRIVNKGLILDEGKYLSDYPLTTGDLIKVEEIEK